MRWHSNSWPYSPRWRGLKEKSGISESQVKVFPAYAGVEESTTRGGRLLPNIVRLNANQSHLFKTRKEDQNGTAQTSTPGWG